MAQQSSLIPDNRRCQHLTAQRVRCGRYAEVTDGVLGLPRAILAREATT